MIQTSPPIMISVARTYGDDISKGKILSAARSMVERGLVDAGYKYLNIGDGWSEMTRDSNGDLRADAEKLGGSLADLASEISTLGISLAIVTSGGTSTPNGYPGSFGHEYEDAEFFTKSGVGLICHDFRSAPRRTDRVTLIRRMGMALRAAGDRTVYSVYAGDGDHVRMIRSTGAHLYRGSSFEDSDGVNVPPDETNGYSVPGSLYNCGEIVIKSSTNERSVKKDLITLATASSPITVDADVTMLSDGMIDLLCDRDIISVATDAECRPARMMADPPRAVYLKVLDNNRYAAAFINYGEERADVTFFAHDMGLTRDAARFIVAEEAGGGGIRSSFEDELTVSLEGGSAKLFILRLEKKGGERK